MSAALPLATVELPLPTLEANAADAAYSAAYAAARNRVLRECADIVRRHYSTPPALETAQ